MQTKEFAWGVCNPVIGPVQVGIFKQFLRLLFLLREGLGARGEWGCQIQSVINEHLKDLIVAAKMFKFIIMF